MLRIAGDEIVIDTQWLVLGDSVSKGIVLNESNGRYEKSEQSFITLVADKSGATVKNLSMFGATVKKGLDLFERHQADINEQGLAILEFGGNDCDFLWPEISEQPEREHVPNIPFEKFHNLYQALIEKCKAKGLMPVLLSLPPLDADRYFATFSKKLDKENLLRWLQGTTRTIYQWHEAYNATIAVLAQETKSFYLDIRRPFLLSKQPEDYICSDGIHPNQKGHRLIADFVIQRLSRLEASVRVSVNEFTFGANSHLVPGTECEFIMDLPW